MNKRHFLSIIFKIVIILIFPSFIFFSCKENNKINTNPSVKLHFSTDTVMFDTIFTTVGSTTKELKIYNKEKQNINISYIRLARGNDSPYQLNINGTSSISMNNVEIRADDSLYIFIRVTIDPNRDKMIETDSILFETNGNLQDVDLVAWGQDANYFTPDTYREHLPPYKIVVHENENITWTKDKPYVIYGYAVVDSTGILNINPGVKIYFHHNSGLWVYKGGSIKVNGTIDKPVTFQGDRLEEFYKDLPGQWDRIWLNEGSIDNEFNYAVIKNAFIGIQAETLESNMGNKLILKNTIIENMTGIGLFTRAYKVVAFNDVIANCGGYCLALSSGGNYDFRHCTIGNYWDNSIRLTPSLYLNNYIDYLNENGQITDHYEFDLTKAYFGNCIIYGNNYEEIGLDKKYDGAFNYQFDHCLLKTKLNTNDEKYYTNCIKNQDPLFTNYNENNYELDSIISSAIDTGSMEVINSSLFNITNDIKGNSRTSDNKPDLGAYEFVKEE